MLINVLIENKIVSVNVNDEKIPIESESDQSANNAD